MRDAVLCQPRHQPVCIGEKILLSKFSVKKPLTVFVAVIAVLVLGAVEGNRAQIRIIEVKRCRDTRPAAQIQPSLIQLFQKPARILTFPETHIEQVKDLH